MAKTNIFRLKARQELAKKLSLEKSLSSNLGILFNKITSDFKSSLIQGNDINLKKYDDDLQNILKKHYSNVSFEFRDDAIRISNVITKARNINQVLENNMLNKELIKFVLSELKKEPLSRLVSEKVLYERAVQIANETRNAQVGAINRFINKNSILISNVLLETTQKDIGIAVAKGFEITAERSVQIEAAVNSLRSKLKNRIDTISLTETQGISEFTKQAQAESIILTGAKNNTRASSIIDEEDVDIENVSFRGEVGFKTWETFGDDKVRDAHQEANGQRQLITSPFIVGGEQMMYPRDTALGASIWNWINCRCSSIVVF